MSLDSDLLVCDWSRESTCMVNVGSLPPVPDDEDPDWVSESAADGFGGL